MKNKLLLLSVFSIFTLSLKAQELNNDQVWDILTKDIKVRYFYSIKYNALLPSPKFGKRVKKLNGQKITVRGFFLPVDITSDVFVLSYNPMNMCFFCTGSGIETIIELDVSPKNIKPFQDLKTDCYFEVTGKLKINAKNHQHLVYILEEATFIKIINN